MKLILRSGGFLCYCSLLWHHATDDGDEDDKKEGQRWGGVVLSLDYGVGGVHVQDGGGRCVPVQDGGGVGVLSQDGGGVGVLS